MELKAFLVFLGMTLAAARPNWRELHGYTFEKYVSDFKLQMKEGTTEFEENRKVFTKEVARMIAHNAGNASWKENVNHMTLMSSSEKQSVKGHNKAVAQASAGKLSHQKDLPTNYKMMTVSDLPTNVDWRKEGVATAVKDQGHCGSCWAFAATAAIESHVAISSGMLFDLSPQQIAACAPNPDSCGGTGNCNGATCELAFDYVAGSRKGLVESFMYPYDEYYGDEYACDVPLRSSGKAHIDGFHKMETNDYVGLMNAVAREGPVAITVDASEWHNYESGIFDGCNQENPDLNHGVVLMGYGTDNGQDYWLVRNSWSASYGEAGYIRVARTQDEGARCGTDNTPLDGVACEGETEPVTVCGTCGILYDTSYPTGVTA